LAEGLPPAVVEGDEVDGADEPVEEMRGCSHGSPAASTHRHPAHAPEDGLDHEKEESVDDVRDKAYPESRRAGGRFHARRVGGDGRRGAVLSGPDSRPRA